MMEDGELDRRISELFNSAPALHTDGGGEPVNWGIDARMVSVFRQFIRPGTPTAETGAGLSTILFLLLGAVHRSITPDEREVERILTYCESNGIPTATYHPIVGYSEHVLPVLGSDIRLDFALIDGNHAFPTPYIDWYYFTNHLNTSGVIALDDIQLWSCRTLADFLDEEEVWENLTRNDRFAVYRMTAPGDGVLRRWWGQQPFVVRHSPVTTHADSQDLPAAAQSATEQKVCDYIAVPAEDRLLGGRIGGMLSRPQESASERARPKLTVAVPFPVYPPVGGGQQRVFSLYRHVARHFDVDLVTLAESDTEFFEREIATGMREIRIPKSVRHQTEEARIAQKVGGVPVGDIGISLFVKHTPEFGRHLARSIETADLVVACHPYSFPAVREALGGRPLVYEAQDVEFLLKKAVLGKSGAIGADLVDTVRELEAEVCHVSSLIFGCSEEDRDELCHLYGVDPARIVIVPNGVDTEAVRFKSPAARDQLKAEFGLAGQRIALFVGSWHPPNLEAAEVLFEIARAVPQVKFLLAGSLCFALADRPRPANVGLIGVVDEETLTALLALADVALNPMLGGSGTNLKLATYLAAGAPVVTTPVGARGYDLVDGDNALICLAEDFPDKIAQMLNDKALAEGLARRGRRLVEQQHDWKAIASGVVPALCSLLHLPTGSTAPLDDLIDRVSEGIVELGIPEDLPLVGQVAAGMADMGFHRAAP